MSLSTKIEEKRRLKEKARKAEATKNIGIGLATGVVAGAIGGVLLAPKSGKDTRCELKEASNKVAGKVGSTLKETYKVMGDKILVKREDIKTLVDAKKVKTEDIIVSEVTE